MRRVAAWLLLALAATAGAAGEPRVEPLPQPARVNAALAELGRHLFFETRLSGDGSRSCASCHAPDRGYADGRALSRGYNGTEHFRNAPGLLSVRLRARLMWDGRYGGEQLEQAVREMVTDAQFMNGDPGTIEQRLRQLPKLHALWQRAYPGEPRASGVFAAIAEYLRTLDFPPSRVDAMLRGETVRVAPLAEEGLRLFATKAGCVQCHHGPLLSDGQAHRLGVADHPAIGAEPLRLVSLLRHNAIMGLPHPMSERTDSGAYAHTKVFAARGAFITPSLRGLRDTGPYMHNGMLASLEEVVEFYDRGGGPGGALRPLGLVAREKQALVALLRELSPAREVPPAPEASDYGLVERR
jgi:cytochrome c peroxidase